MTVIAIFVQFCGVPLKALVCAMVKRLPYKSYPVCRRVMKIASLMCFSLGNVRDLLLLLMGTDRSSRPRLPKLSSTCCLWKGEASHYVKLVTYFAFVGVIFAPAKLLAS